MRLTKLTRFVLSTRDGLGYLAAAGIAVFLIAMGLVADPPADGELKVLKMGLGSGLVTSSPGGSPGPINCPPTCSATFPSAPEVVLTASPQPGSTFVGWSTDPDADPSPTPDCVVTVNPCRLTMDAHRSVRAVFDLSPDINRLVDPISPESIETYLALPANANVDTPAEFLRALPDEYKYNWILMTRSESLQTGIADSPRILLPSPDAKNVFTIGMTTNSSYPGSHPNAIEYMQWDQVQKNFRFHEIVLQNIGEMGNEITLLDGSRVRAIGPRTRGIHKDDEKCSRCHSTRNVLNLNRSVDPPITGATHGTEIPPLGTGLAKNKPNWDSYDSWGGMLPFNRDRIYQGSVEAAAFRKIFNPWTWETNEPVRSIIEQLKLQPPPSVASEDVITRLRGGRSDGAIKFAFDPSPPPTVEPSPVGSISPLRVTYSFDRAPGPTPGTLVERSGRYVMLRHTSDRLTSAVDVEGRGVQLFDLLGGLDGDLNAQRIASELVNHRYGPGSREIDVRPIALAITTGCVSVNEAVSPVRITPAFATTITDFFDYRNGLNFSELYADTETRATSTSPETRSPSLTRRKADIQKFNLDRTSDPYLASTTNGLVRQYGLGTSEGIDTDVRRIRQDVFRRPTRPTEPLGSVDYTVMGGPYVDREDYDYNTDRVALYRYFLEPLGVSVDKWSMNVRGRSRLYNFADVFSNYRGALESELVSSLISDPRGLTLPDPTNCTALRSAIDATFTRLPAADEIPKYTDVQRVFNKSCIECHGGLGYPPYSNYGNRLDLSENERPGTMSRLIRPHANAEPRALSRSGPIFDYITRTNEDCPPFGLGMMPCGGPPLSKRDITLIGRWIDGGHLYTEGDPHLRTINGVYYDFQSAGEFVLLRDETLEIQARQTPVETAGPISNDHTQLLSCVSLNSAVAVRIGDHRITYEPNLNGERDPNGLELRIDGKLTKMSSRELLLAHGGRIVQTAEPGSIQIESPGGAIIAVTPGWWPDYQVWYLNINVSHARATDGVIGTIARDSWLPVLPDGTDLGERPGDPHERYVNIYQRFADAWRVTDATSLFDYAPGTTTSTFTLRGWPVENPTNCQLPRQWSGPRPAQPISGMAAEVAQQHCSQIVEPERKANCIQDVTVTGNPGFAKTYLVTDQNERNAIPTPPILGLPDDRLDLTQPVTFTWNTSTDADDKGLTYKHCVWDIHKGFTLNDCQVTSSQSVSWWRGGLRQALWVLIVGLILLALAILLGKRRKPVFVALVLIGILAGLFLAFYLGRHRASSANLAKTVSGLESGKSYFWKVIAEDAKGGSAESKTRRVNVK
jgi:Divergent InlB B-repeat domain